MKRPPHFQTTSPAWAILLTLALVCLFAPSTFAQEPAAITETLILTGRVLSNVDSKPLSGVHIVMIDPYFPDEYDVATTDSSGRYTVTETIVETFPGLIPGSYHLEFKPTGTHLPEYYNNTHTLEAAALLDLSVNAVTSGIDASLTAGGQIRGKVISQHNGQPVTQAQVTLYTLAGEPVQSSTVMTNSGGDYELVGIPSGDYKLNVQPLDADSFYVELYYPNKQTPAGAEIFKITEDKVYNNIDFSLPLGGDIMGKVISSASNQIGVEPLVEVYDLAGNLMPAKISYPDNNGEFFYRLTNLLPGQYHLLFRDANNDHWPEYYDNKPTLATASPVVVTAGQLLTNVNAELKLKFIVTSIATSSALPNRIILTFNYSPAPVYTINGGQSWHQMTTIPWALPNSLSAPRIGIAPRQDQNGSLRMLIAAGEGNDGLYRTGDNGRNWSRQRFSFDFCNTNYSFTNPVASPATPSQLYMGNSCVTHGRSTDSSYYSRLLRSEDAGVTWQELSTLDSTSYTDRIFPSPMIQDRIYLFGLYPQYGNAQWLQSNDGGEQWQARAFPVAELALDGKDAARLYGVSAVDGSAENSRLGVRSADGGNQWVNWVQQPCELGQYPIAEDDVIQLMAHPTQTNVIFLRCTQGLYRSKDGGDSWTELASEPGRLLSPDYGIPGRILWAKDDALWASTDSGDTWQSIMPEYKSSPTAARLPLFLPSVSNDSP